ncbi:MAG: protein translocase subunit SecF [Candidatus Aenigmarchaeota archaeon]|nr:protein translocase subunit SecF [Candidatus Aenigmarchaeota archaeon]
MSLQSLEDFYHKKWKFLMFITIVVLIVASSFLIYNTVTTGSPVKRDIELTGGTLISMTLDKQPDINKLSAEIPDATFKTVTGIKTTLLIETDSSKNTTEIINKLDSLGVSGDYDIKQVGPSLGEVFWKQAQIALIAAFIIMAIVVFLLFRAFAPSMAVILAAITDIVISMFGMELLGISLSLPTLAAILMLIGYSVDTDIVLTTEMLKRKEETVEKRIKTAMKTGVTMTACAIAALVAMYFVSGSHVLQQMALVLIVGLLIDLPATWLTNTGILRWYLERQDKKKQTN